MSISDFDFNGYQEKARQGEGVPAIYVDVDGTLLIWPGPKSGRAPRKDEPGYGLPPKINTDLINRLKSWREKTGGQIVVWSMAGAEHAKRANDWCGLNADACLRKITHTVDDVGLKWLQKRIDRNAIPTYGPFEEF